MAFTRMFSCLSTFPKRTMTRIYRSLVVVVLLLTGRGTDAVSGTQKFVYDEGPRAMSVHFSTFIFPSALVPFSEAGPLSWYDNFSVNGSVTNIVARGPNLHMYGSYTHTIAPSFVYDFDAMKTYTSKEVERTRDVLNVDTRYIFGDLWQIQLKNRWGQDVLTEPDSALSLQYCRRFYEGRLGIAHDRRYSSRETWYPGKRFKYPEEGSYGALYVLHRTAQRVFTHHSSHFEGMEMRYNQLVHLVHLFVFSVNVHGKTFFSPLPGEAKMLKSAIGGVSVPCDYWARITPEVRYASRKGVFWQSPAFYYVPRILFKVSPGIAGGYDYVRSGNFNHSQREHAASVYVSPLCLVRMNGNLSFLLRMNAAYAIQRKTMAFTFSGSMNM